MRILAIETSGRTGDVAVLDGPRLIGHEDLPGQRRSTQALAPAVRTLLEQAGWAPSQVELVAVSVGPGSFTGLRLGIATAKLFAYATGCKVRGVQTLRAIAAQVAGTPTDVEALLDAGRGELLSGHFRFATSGSPEPTRPTRLGPASDWRPEHERNLTLTGEGLKLVMDKLPAHVQCAPVATWAPRAETIARLALEDVRVGQIDDVWTLAPIYYRRSAAEEVWEAKSPR